MVKKPAIFKIHKNTSIYIYVSNGGIFMQNKSKIIKFQIFSVIFVSILGTLLHFTYEWSNGNEIVGAFSAVNESTWEHLKLLFFPMLITIIIGYFYMDKNTKIICAKLIGIITAILFIIIFFYTYTTIAGTNFAILDIGSFFVAVILGEYVAYKILISKNICNTNIAIIILTILLISFIAFTYIPPKIFLFQDPITRGYGIKK